MRKKLTIIGLILAIVWMGIIFFFSSRTSNDLMPSQSFLTKSVISFFYGTKFATFPLNIQNEISDNIQYVIVKTAHFAEFGILCLFWFMALNRVNKYRLNYLLSFIITVLYALSDEIHQLFSSGRTPRFEDVLIDSLGALFIILVIELIRTIKAGRNMGKNYD